MNIRSCYNLIFIFINLKIIASQNKTAINLKTKHGEPHLKLNPNGTQSPINLRLETYKEFEAEKADSNQAIKALNHAFHKEKESPTEKNDDKVEQNELRIKQLMQELALSSRLNQKKPTNLIKKAQQPLDTNELAKLAARENNYKSNSTYLHENQIKNSINKHNERRRIPLNAASTRNSNKNYYKNNDNENKNQNHNKYKTHRHNYEESTPDNEMAMMMMSNDNAKLDKYLNDALANFKRQHSLKNQQQHQPSEPENKIENIDKKLDNSESSINTQGKIEVNYKNKNKAKNNDEIMSIENEKFIGNLSTKPINSNAIQMGLEKFSIIKANEALSLDKTNNKTNNEVNISNIAKIATATNAATKELLNMQYKSQIPKINQTNSKHEKQKLKSEHFENFNKNAQKLQSSSASNIPNATLDKTENGFSNENVMDKRKSVFNMTTMEIVGENQKNKTIANRYGNLTTVTFLGNIQKQQNFNLSSKAFSEQQLRKQTTFQNMKNENKTTFSNENTRPEFLKISKEKLFVSQAAENSVESAESENRNGNQITENQKVNINETLKHFKIVVENTELFNVSNEPQKSFKAFQKQISNQNQKQKSNSNTNNLTKNFEAKKINSFHGKNQTAQNLPQPNSNLTIFKNHSERIFYYRQQPNLAKRSSNLTRKVFNITKNPQNHFESHTNHTQVWHKNFSNANLTPTFPLKSLGSIKNVTKLITNQVNKTQKAKDHVSNTVENQINDSMLEHQKAMVRFIDQNKRLDPQSNFSATDPQTERNQFLTNQQLVIKTNVTNSIGLENNIQATSNNNTKFILNNEISITNSSLFKQITENISENKVAAMNLNSSNHTTVNPKNQINNDLSSKRKALDKTNKAENDGLGLDEKFKDLEHEVNLSSNIRNVAQAYIENKPMPELNENFTRIFEPETKLVIENGDNTKSLSTISTNDIKSIFENGTQSHSSDELKQKVNEKAQTIHNNSTKNLKTSAKNASQAIVYNHRDSNEGPLSTFTKADTNTSFTTVILKDQNFSKNNREKINLDADFDTENMNSTTLKIDNTNLDKASIKVKPTDFKQPITMSQLSNNFTDKETKEWLNDSMALYSNNDTMDLETAVPVPIESQKDVSAYNESTISRPIEPINSLRTPMTTIAPNIEVQLSNTHAKNNTLKDIGNTDIEDHKPLKAFNDSQVNVGLAQVVFNAVKESIGATQAADFLAENNQQVLKNSSINPNHYAVLYNVKASISEMPQQNISTETQNAEHPHNQTKYKKIQCTNNSHLAPLTPTEMSATPKNAINYNLTSLKELENLVGDFIRRQLDELENQNTTQALNIQMNHEQTDELVKKIKALENTKTIQEEISATINCYEAKEVANAAANLITINNNKSDEKLKPIQPTIQHVANEAKSRGNNSSKHDEQIRLNSNDMKMTQQATIDDLDSVTKIDNDDNDKNDEANAVADETAEIKVEENYDDTENSNKVFSLTGPAMKTTKAANTVDDERLKAQKTQLSMETMARKALKSIEADEHSTYNDYVVGTFSSNDNEHKNNERKLMASGDDNDDYNDERVNKEVITDKLYKAKYNNSPSISKAAQEKVIETENDKKYKSEAAVGIGIDDTNTDYRIEAEKMDFRDKTIPVNDKMKENSINTEISMTEQRKQFAAYGTIGNKSKTATTITTTTNNSSTGNNIQSMSTSLMNQRSNSNNQSNSQQKVDVGDKYDEAKKQDFHLAAASSTLGVNNEDFSTLPISLSAQNQQLLNGNTLAANEKNLQQHMVNENDVDDVDVDGPTEITTTNWWHTLPYAEIRKFLNTIFESETAHELYTEIARKSKEIQSGQHSKEIESSIVSNADEQATVDSADIGSNDASGIDIDAHFKQHKVWSISLADLWSMLW